MSESIIQELKAAGLGLQIVDSPEGADVVLQFNAAASPPARPVKATNDKMARRKATVMGALDDDEDDIKPEPLKKPRPGTGFVVVHKEDGERIISSLQKTPSAKIPGMAGITQMPSKPAARFAREFIYALKAANGKQ